MRKITMMILAAMTVMTVRAEKLVYSGAFLPSDDGVGALMFAGKDIDNFDIISSVWDEAYTLGFGYKAAPFFARRSGSGANAELEVQLQHYNKVDSRCVKIVLRQHGDDIYGAVVYAKYATGSCMVGEDWDTFYAPSYEVHVEPETADRKYGLGINQLMMATRPEEGMIVTEVEGEAVSTIGSGDAYTVDRVGAFNIPGLQIGDAGLLNVLLKRNDKWDTEPRAFNLPLTGEGGRVRFSLGEAATRPDCAYSVISVSSSTNAGYLGWSNADKKLVAKNVPIPLITGFECSLAYRPSFAVDSITITDTKITNFENLGTSCTFQVRGYDEVNDKFRFVRVRLVTADYDVWGYMDKLGEWTGTIDDVLDMESFGNSGLCNREDSVGLGVSGGQVLIKADEHLGWSRANRHLVAPGVAHSDVIDFTGTVYKRTGGVTKKMINCRSYGFEKTASDVFVQMRGVDPDDSTHIYFCYVLVSNFDGNLCGWILKLGDYIGTLDDEIDLTMYGNAGISNWALQNGQGVCDFRPVCDMGTGATEIKLGGSTTAGADGVLDLEGAGASKLTVTVTNVAALPAGGVINIRTNAELIVAGGNNAYIPSSTINVFRGGTLRVKGDYELSASTAVFLYGGEFQIGYGRNADGDAYQHAYYLYFANGARVFGARPRLSNWQQTFWKVAGRTPSACDCDVQLIPGSSNNTGFYLDVYDITGDEDSDFSFNGKIIKAGSKSPTEGGVPCYVIKRLDGMLSLDKADCDFLDWYPLQIEGGAVRLGVSGALASAAAGAVIEMSNNTKIITAANTSNSANTLKINADSAATIELGAGSSLTFSGLEFGTGTAALTIIGDLKTSAIRFTTVLTADQLSRIRVKESASDNARSVVQNADGGLGVGGLLVIFR